MLKKLNEVMEEIESRILVCDMRDDMCEKVKYDQTRMELLKIIKRLKRMEV